MPPWRPESWYRVRIGRFAVFLEDVDIRPLMTNCQKRGRPPALTTPVKISPACRNCFTRRRRGVQVPTEPPFFQAFTSRKLTSSNQAGGQTCHARSGHSFIRRLTERPQRFGRCGILWQMLSSSRSFFLVSSTVSGSHCWPIFIFPTYWQTCRRECLAFDVFTVLKLDREWKITQKLFPGIIDWNSHDRGRNLAAVAISLGQNEPLVANSKIAARQDCFATRPRVYH